MKLKPDQRISAEVAEARAMEALTKSIGRPMYASEIANVIWPHHCMKAQGAGAAASRILKRLERKKLAKWKFIAYVGQGWCKT